MAKSNSFFGLRRGSTKSHTFSVFNGKQITKDRVDTIKNPRSLEQMVNRMYMKTIGLAYSNMKQIVDHSFEGKTYGLQSMMYFSKRNSRHLRNLEANPAYGVQFAPYQYDKFVANPFIIAEGSASKLLISASVVQSAGTITAAFTSAVQGATTANALFAALGISVGDLATICFAWEDAEVNAHFDFIRLTALQAGDVQLTTDNVSDYILIESTLPVGTPTFGTEAVTISIPVTAADAGANQSISFATIHSVKADNKWLRSTAVLSGVEGFGGSLFDDAIATYPVGESYVLNGGDF